MKKIYLKVAVIASLLILLAVVAFYRISPTPKSPEFAGTVVYDPLKGLVPKGVVAPSADEPAFSLSLKKLWSVQEVISPVNRLLISSESHYFKDYKYQAVIGVNLLRPQGQTLEEAVKKEKEALLKAGIPKEIISEKKVKIGRLEGYRFEFISKGEDNEVVDIVGENGSLMHQRETFFLKDGYLVDLFASAYEWAWPQFVQEIEETINSFYFLSR